MDKDYYIKLTLAVYRVTELFPQKEPLKYQIREKANNLLADLILASISNPGPGDKDILSVINKDIEIIGAFFDLAQTQNWVDSRNFPALKEEYEKISRFLKQFQEIRDKEIESNEEVFGSKEVLTPQKDEKAGVNFRQRKILKILEKKDKIQVWEIKKIFSEVSKRTLRRDFEYLLNQGFIKRIGEKNNTFYQLLKPQNNPVGQEIKQ